MQIGILEGDCFSEKAIRMLAEIGNVEIYSGGKLEKFLSDKEVLFIRLGHQIDRTFLQMLPRLRYLCSPTTGHNHIDIDELARRSITIVSLKGQRDFLMGIRATPEHTLGLILALLRNYRHAFLSSVNNHWDRDSCRGYEIYQNSVGVIGMGRVGEILNSYLQAFGAHVYYFDVDHSINSDSAIRYTDLGEMILKCKIIVLCASYSDGNDVLLNASHFASMAGKFFVNTARGELIDEAALLEYINTQHFAGVATDVIQNECGENRLQQWLQATVKSNVIVTPHIAGATYSSMHRTEEYITKQLIVTMKQEI